MLTLERAISYGPFFQRMEPLFIFNWVIASLISVTVLFYSSVICYCKTFRVQDTRPVIFPMSICLFISVMMPNDFRGAVEGSIQTAREYGWAVFFGLPIICLVVTGFRKIVKIVVA